MGFLNGFKFCCCFLFLFWIWFCSGDLFTDCTVVNHHHLPPFWSLLDFFPTIEHANPSCCEVIFAFELYEGERRSQSFGKGAAKISKMTPTYPGNMYFLGGTWCVMFQGSDRIVLYICVSTSESTKKTKYIKMPSCRVVICFKWKMV